MVVLPKKDRRPRRTVDFQRLNSASTRETHQSRLPFHIITSVPKHTFRTVADAYSGYHQIPLNEESRKLTAFITPWGRFKYCRTPMRHCAAQDAFTKRFDDIISYVSRKMNEVCRRYADTEKEAVHRTYWRNIYQISNTDKQFDQETEERVTEDLALQADQLIPD